jgi:hypothetical protein
MEGSDISLTSQTDLTSQMNSSSSANVVNSNLPKSEDSPQSTQIDLTSKINYTMDMNTLDSNSSECESSSHSDQIESTSQMEYIEGTKSQQSSQTNLSDQDNLTKTELEFVFSKKNITPSSDQIDLTGQVCSTIDIGDHNPPLEEFLGQANQTHLTVQNDLTGNMAKQNKLVKNTASQIGKIKLPRMNNLTTKMTEIVKVVGLSGAGALAIFQKIVGSSGAYVRTRTLARDLGMTYQALLHQIDRLTEAGYIISPPGTQSMGRWIQLTATSQFLLTGQNDTTTLVNNNYHNQPELEKNEYGQNNTTTQSGVLNFGNNDDQIKDISQMKKTEEIREKEKNDAIQEALNRLYIYMCVFIIIK